MYLENTTVTFFDSVPEMIQTNTAPSAHLKCTVPRSSHTQRCAAAATVEFQNKVIAQNKSPSPLAATALPAVPGCRGSTFPPSGFAFCQIHRITQLFRWVCNTVLLENKLGYQRATRGFFH